MKPKRHKGKTSAAVNSGDFAPLSARRRWAFRLLAMVVLPLLTAVLVESGLRLAGYGYPTGFFKKIRFGSEDYLVENDKFGLRFFPAEISRSPAPLVMRAHKAPGTCRIFVFGESAALGDPRPAFGAPRYLQVLLRERFPQTRFEVVCVAMTAINSHAVLPIALECARDEGEAWIIYMGNNEMVGPFGAASVFGAQAPPLTLVRASLALQKTRLGQLLAAVSRKLAKRSSEPSTWEGMEMFVRNRVPPRGPSREVVYRNFSKNLADILRTGQKAGVGLVLNSVAVNLRDCPPFALWPTTNLPAVQAACVQLVQAGLTAESQTNLASAADSFAKALEWDQDRADVHFRLATALLGLTNASQAHAHFEKACDLDALPFRADSRINAAIRQAAGELKTGRLAFLDAALVLATNAPGEVAGHESFYEHVHLNFDGNYRLGLAWAEQVAGLLPQNLLGKATGAWAPQELCERRLGLTDWNRAGVIEDVIRRLGQPPLSWQSNNGQRVAEFLAWLTELRRGMTPEAAAKAREVYREALNLQPEDFRLHESYAEFLEATGALADAVAEWQQVRQLIPHHHLGYFHSGRLLARLGRIAEAQADLGHAITLRPDLGDGWLELGKTHAAEGNNEQALRDYERARRLLPRDCRVYYFLGRCFSKLNRPVEAVASLRKAIEFKPDYWEAIYTLGEELAFKGKDAEARRCFKEVLQLKPNYVMAHFNLGVSLAKALRWEEAAFEFEEVLRLEPENQQAKRYLDQVRGRKAAPKERTAPGK